MKIHSSLKRLLKASASLVTATALSATLISASATAEEITYGEGKDQTPWPGSDVKEEVDAYDNVSNQVTVIGVNAEYDKLYAAYTNASYDGPSSLSHNSATLDASTLENVYGAYVEGGDDPYGGASCSLSNNTVTLTNKSYVTENVYAAHTSNGDCKDNHLVIDNSTAGEMSHNVACAADTGDGSATGNTVTLTGSTARCVYAALAGRGEATDNHVTIKEDSKVTSSVEGANAATASRNSVTISGASTVSDSVYGANAEVATGNSVLLEGGSTVEDGTLIGGHGTSSASGNSVTIHNATVTGEVVGGSTGEGGSATDNSVTLQGTQNNLESATIYGGQSWSSDAEFVSGNTLTLQGFEGTVAGIRNFAVVEFVIEQWANGSSILTLTDKASVLDTFTLNVNFSQWNEGDAGLVTLISGLSSKSTLGDINVSFGETATLAEGSESPVSVKLVEREDKRLDLVAYTAGFDPDAVPEPATATLSLLALVGLAARRRRK